MSAGAQSKTVAPISEVGSELDLNLSLNLTTATLFQDQQRRQELQPELESFDQQPGLNLAPAVSPDQQVVDLKNLPTSDEVEDGGSENSSLSTTNRKRNLPDEPRQSLGENSMKKLRLSLDQAVVLEEAFKKHTSLDPRQKEALAKRLGLRKRQVEVWFQNRRARTKMKKTEVECEYMKQNFIGLIERVQRLQKEVSELRALNLPPQFYMQIPPATTWTFCPSCERVGIPTPAADPVNAGRVELHRNMGRLEAVSLNPWASPGQMT